MFGLFKKKEKPKEKNPLGEEYRTFAAQFLPDELNILVVTGASGFGGGKAQGDELWTAGIGLTAWMEEDSPDIHQGDFRLVTKADDTLMNYLRQRTPRDFILKCKARLSEDGKQLLLTNLPEPGFDPDLKAILEEQKKPVTEEIEGLGTFTLNRSVGVFQTEVEWQERSVQLCFDRDENRADCVQVAQTLLADQAGWDAKARAFAADKLLDLANEWAVDADEDEVTREDFISRLELETIDVSENDIFQLWFNDGELFFGHVIHVSGSLKDGITDAQMEG